MDNLFGKSEVEKLRDLDYKTNSHTFSKGVIAAYYNGLEYPMIVTKDVISIKRKKDKVLFILNENLVPVNVEELIYTKVKTPYQKIKTKEVVYDIKKIFTNKDKQTRRGITLTNRKEIVLRETTSEEIEQLYKEWAEHKMNDPKVFRISFTPKRYIRSFKLKEKGFKVIHIPYYVKGELYGVLAYEIQDDIAFELAFISRYWRDDLKIINDLNECILINSFYELYKQGINKVNVGPTAGIKGLKVFKAKLPSEEVIIYSN